MGLRRLKKIAEPLFLGLGRLKKDRRAFVFGTRGGLKKIAEPFFSTDLYTVFFKNAKNVSKNGFVGKNLIE